jgi:transposase, IS30 family
VHLDLDERRQVARWRDAKMSVAEIALRLGRAPSTIYRELRRNFFRDVENGYYGLNAQAMAERRRHVKRKLVRFPLVKAAVLDRLKGGWSPEQIAGRGSVTRRSIVMHIPGKVRRMRSIAICHSIGASAAGVAGDVPTPCGSAWKTASPCVPLPSRPRTEFGHWECDLMMFRKEFGTANVTSLVERVSRFTLLARNPDRQSKPVMEGVIAGLSPLPKQARRSITFDRGTEFSAWLHLQAGLGTQTWFCDPQAPWQKGTVENTNNRLRTWLPRKADPTALTHAQLKSICAPLNATPRKCLGYQTPDEIFRAKLLEIMRAEG